ncbi:DUF1508 domain-containing protein [Calidifontibacter terrae]
MIHTIKILQSSNGQYWFRVSATNGKILCSSETYWNYNDCYSAARMIQNGGGNIE